MATYQLKPDLLLQKVADEMVLLEPESGEYFTLNSVGADMLELMQQGKSAPEIAQHIATDYDVPTTQVQADLDELLKQLEEANLADLVSD